MLGDIVKVFCVSIALLLSTAAAGDEANLPDRHETTPEDVNAIMQVTKDFRSAVIAKDVKRLSALMFNSNILFDSPQSAKVVRAVSETNDVNYDGLSSGGYALFAQFLATTHSSTEETFRNVKITQDGHLAWVMFDYEFLSDGKVDNFGVEVWQMLKATGNKWKIFSVVWSSHRPPK